MQVHSFSRCGCTRVLLDAKLRKPPDHDRVTPERRWWWRRWADRSR